MDEQRKETHMARLWGWRVPKRGLGLLMTEHGLALAQSQASVRLGDQHCAWHWHRWSASDSPDAFAAWPDPGQLKKALARSGFQAQATAVAVPETQLQRFSLSLEPRPRTRRVHAGLAAQLSSSRSGFAVGAPRAPLASQLALAGVCAKPCRPRQ